jgi:predicted HAD superfamily Cof-like phosphohydrolase
VGIFHQKFDLANNIDQPIGPRPMPKDLLEMRLNFLLEEVGELIEAVGGRVELSDIVVAGSRSVRVVLPDDVDIDHAKAFDALIDTVYVACGTAQLFGYPWQEGWQLVQAANMAKERAISADQSLRGSTYDVIKPEGWTPPDIEGLLQSYGWNVNQYAHDPNGSQCAPEFCGGSRNDPCTYGFDDIARFTEMEKGNNPHSYMAGHTGRTCEQLYVDGSDAGEVCGLKPNHPIHTQTLEESLGEDSRHPEEPNR